jgi:beta-phosphoglucomutase-like phosphatase (HAD superfamily)
MQDLLKSTNFPLDVDILVSSKQVLNAKPEGDIYLKIARLLGIKANTLTIIDSTLNGVQASYLANSKGLYLAQFHEANSTIKKFAYAHFKQSDELNHYVLNLINQSE